MKINHLFCALTLSATIAACDKKDPEPKPPTVTELLTGKKWQVRTVIISSANQNDVDLYALVPPASRDNFEQYNTPNTYVVDEGATKARPTDPQTQLGIWAFSNNETQLTVTYRGLTNSYIIDELTEKSFKTRLLQPQSNGITATITTSRSRIE